MTLDVEKYLRATGRSPTNRKRKPAPETGATSPAPETTPALRIVDAGSFRPAGLAARMETDPREHWMDLPRTGVLALGSAATGASSFWQDSFYHVKALDRLLAHARQPGNGVDLYVTQATFQKRASKAGENLGLGLLAHCDLDAYAAPALAGDRTMSQVIGAVLAGIDDANLPRPSYLVFSGRGFYAKWLLTGPAPRRALSRLRAVNVEIATRLADLGADRKAVDVSRVLRVVGSVNSKSGQQVRVVWANETPAGALVTYSLDQLSSEILPRSADDHRADRAAARAARQPLDRHPEAVRLERERAAARRPRQRGAFPAEVWARLVLGDLESLVNSRWGTVPEGHRNTVATLAGCALARTVEPAALETEWGAWVSRFLPAGYAEGAEFRRLARSLLRRARRAADGETVEHDGEALPVVYTYAKETVVALLGITADEQRGLRALIGPAEKERRRREARRERGRNDRQRVTGHDRAAYTAERAKAAQERAQQAQTMRGGGMSWSAIAEALQTTPDGARKLAARAIPAA